MNNADKFKSLFGIYATELWAMPEKDFLKWLNSEAMNSSESPNGWIPCSERLPEEDSEVLCCDTHGEFIIGRPYAEEEANNGFSAEGDNDYLVDCVAWQPLPEKFKEEGGKE